MLFIEYPKCSTCRKAKKWLEENGAEFEDRHIAENRPSREELEQWVALSGLPIRKFFNTSGLKNRELGLKDRLPSMTEEEQLTLLASDGMLVKRPLLIGENFAVPGFQEQVWREYLKR